MDNDEMKSRKAMMPGYNQEMEDKAIEMSKAMVDNKLLIEAGFIGLLKLAYPADLPVHQVREMRNIFFAGAQHLFSSILCVMDADREPTPADLKIMDNIQDELDTFITAFKMQHTPTQGNA